MIRDRAAFWTFYLGSKKEDMKSLTLALFMARHRPIHWLRSISTRVLHIRSNGSNTTSTKARPHSSYHLRSLLPCALLCIAGVAVIADLDSGVSGHEGDSSDLVAGRMAPSVDLKKLSLSFVENKGQFSDTVAFAAQTNASDLFFTKGSVVLNLLSHTAGRSGSATGVSRPTASEREGATLQTESLELKFIGASANTVIRGEDGKSGKFNYLKGTDKRKWISDVSTFGKIRYTGLYEGIDAVFYGNEGRVQYDFLVKPHHAPEKIQFSFPGARAVKLEASGDLQIQSQVGSVGLSRPISYQIENDGTRKEVDSEFVIDRDRHISFRVGKYDKGRDLVIDPIFTYSTLLGGGFDDIGYAVKADSNGNAYIVGSTHSLDFPTSPGGRKPIQGTTDAFVTKLNPQGTDIVYSTVIGSSQDDFGYDIDIDNSGAAYVVGTAGVNFPQQNALKYYSSLYSSPNNVNNWQGTVGLNDPVNTIATDPRDPLVAYAGVNGGVYKTTNAGANWLSVNNGLPSNLPNVTAIGVSAQNSVVFAGATTQLFKSVDGGTSWQTVNFYFGPNTFNSILVDRTNPQFVFVSKGTFLYRSTDGGTSWAQIHSNFLNGNEQIFTIVNHPTIPGFVVAGTFGNMLLSMDYGATWQPGPIGGAFRVLFDVRDPSIIYVATLNGVYRGSLTTFQYAKVSTNLPSAAVYGFQQDPLNRTNFYLVGFFQGILRSTDDGVTWNQYSQGLPSSGQLVVNAISFINGGNSLLAGPNYIPGGTGFALKLNAAGDDLIYSTRLGEMNNAVAVDSGGRAYVGGTIGNNLLPLVNPLHGYSARNDGFISVIAASGGTLDFSTYLGGTQDDFLTDIALDPAGNIYATGQTWSPDFPLTAPFQSTLKGQDDAFVTKIAPDGSGTIYSTFYGGAGNELANAISADASGNAYFTGSTISTDIPLGTNPAIQPVAGGATDSFIAQLNPTGSSLLYATYLGGVGLDITHDIKIGSDGEIVVAGETQSIDFPTVRSLKNKGPFEMSADRGVTWRNDYEGLNAVDIFSFASHPAVPGTLLAGTDEGLYRSTDGGQHWLRSNAGVGTFGIAKVLFDPGNPSIAYAGTFATTPGVSVGGMYKSTDGGASWTQINNGISSSTRQIFAAAIDPTNSNVIYAGSDGFNPGFPLYKSMNGGQSWTALGAVSNIDDIAIDPTNSSIVYAASDIIQPYLFRSTDGGITWSTVVSSGFSRVRSIVIDPKDHTRLYVGADNGVFYSTNQGANWQKVINAGGNGVAFDPIQTTNFYAATSLGLYTSTDRGASWTLQDSGRNHKQLLTVAADAATEGVVYAGSIPFVESDAFVTKIAPSGASFQYSTVFGATGDPNVGNVNPLPLDYAFGLGLGPNGSIFSTGYTRYDNFPTTPGSASDHWSGMDDAFVVRLDESREIRGKVADGGGGPVNGVTIELVGASAQTYSTALDGRYRFSQARVGGDFEVTPRKLGYTFQPASVSIKNLRDDFTANFTAVASTNTISGHVLQGGLPATGVTVTLSGAASSSQQTTADGSYNFQVASGGDYELSASKIGLIFDPSVQKVTNLVSNTTADFSARPGFVISGHVLSSGSGLSGVPIILAGSEQQSVETDINGRFVIEAGAGGNYTVSPMSSFAFAPSSVNIPSLSTAQDLVFNAVPQNLVSGNIAFVGINNVDNVQNFDIFSFSSGSATNLTNNVANDFDPVWSPDGNKLAFVSDRDGNSEIYVMTADGRNQTRITFNPAVDGEPTWSPDSRRIAFVRRPGGTNSSEIYVINADGSNQVRLTNNAIYEYSPAWSPDGGEIAFVSEEDGNAEIYVMDSSGSTRRRLTDNPLPDRDPAWSPDGTWIAFDSGLDGTRQIWKIRRDGTGLTQITVGTADNKSPSFSPDSQQIVFAGLCNPPGLATVSSNGGNQGLLNSCGQYTDAPSWQSRPYVRSKPFDFDGDGKTDLSVFRPQGSGGAAEWWYRRSMNGTVNGLQFGISTDKPVAADFTGDGKTDVAVFRPSNGQWYVLRSEDFSFFSFPFGTSGDIPVPADFDADGKADAAVFRPSTGTWFIQKTTGGTDIIPFARNGDIPVVADYDGDGKADIAIFRPSGASPGAAEWWIRRSSGAGVLAFQFGISTDKAVPGDYTGDGKTDVAIYRPGSPATWYVLRSEDFSFFSFPFGTTGDLPVPGNYDGDAKWDAGVFRPSNKTWFVNQTSGGTLIIPFGVSTDVPVPSTQVGN